jgi:hypothetical protein
LKWASNRTVDLANGSVAVGSNRLFEAKQTKDLLAWLEESDEEESEEGSGGEESD